MESASTDPHTLRCAVVSLSLALEETLKALAEKNGNQPGSWLDEVQDLALLRAKARLSEANDGNAAAAAMGVVEVIFGRMRSGLSAS